LTAVLQRREKAARIEGGSEQNVIFLTNTEPSQIFFGKFAVYVYVCFLADTHHARNNAERKFCL
jgi:hypothetical protein